MRKRLLTVLTSVLAALAIVAPVAADATSGAVYQPDGRVRQPCHVELEDCTPEWFGNNTYNTTAVGQKAFYYDCCGLDAGPAVFRILIQNDGTRNDRIRVLATGRTAGYSVKFFRGTTNITAAVKAGTFRTPWLAPGGRYLIKAKVTHTDASGGDRTARLVALTSVSNPAKQDAVKLVREWVVCGC